MATLAAIVEQYENPRAVGPLCVNGHERAVHERTYPRTDTRWVTRVCMACQREREKQQRAQRAIDRRAISESTHPDAVLWRRFCQTIEQRIQAVRAQTPRCGECGRSS